MKNKKLFLPAIILVSAYFESVGRKTRNVSPIDPYAGSCTVHFIRDVVLEKVVLDAVRNLADFVKCHEPVFLYMLARKNDAMRQQERKRLERVIERGTRRISEIDKLIEAANV